jgi:prepilin-type N-terminal cleavage/methylation domain-containing protein
MRDPHDQGFTLLELLIVIALIMIVAAIAVPGLMRARMSSVEANAIGTMRAILSAQSTYASSCGSGFYAPSFARLAAAPAGGADTYIGPDLAADPVTKSGYRYTLTPGPIAAAAPPSCNGAAAGTLASSYFIAVDPLPATGERHFGANQGGTIYEAVVAVPVTQVGAPAGATPIQ